MNKRRVKSDLIIDFNESGYDFTKNLVKTDDNNEGEERFECDCRLGPEDKPCYTQFDTKDMFDHRIDYQSCDYWDDDCYNLLNERIIAIM